METGFMDKLWRVLGSFELAVVLLVLLGLLTWTGTLEQVDKGLFQVQKEYFESWGVLARVPLPALGSLVVPLPGATLVMSLLFVNLIVGGVMRLRWKWQNAGILITHLGIALLLVAGFVKMYYSVSGRLALFEGQRGASFESFHDWELALLRKQGDDVTERTVPATAFRHARGSKPVVLEGDGLPFRLELSHYMDNCVLRQKGPMVPASTPVVDGVFLQERAPFKQNEANTPGVYVKVVDGQDARSGILWGRDLAPFDRNRYPWTFEAAGSTWGLELRRQQYPLPFSIELDKFIKREHPGTTMPREFTSEVTVHEGRSRHQARITMNAPLRKEGFVAYQASWGPSNRPTGPWYSQFEIARNPSDQWPLYACIVISLGLLLHFGRKLYRYITAENLKRTMQTTKAAAPLLLALLAAPAVGQHDHQHQQGGDAVLYERTFDWDKALVEKLGALPVQYRGRVMPLGTHAAFSLYFLHGRRDLKLGEGRVLTPTEWLLDVLFFPDTAAGYPLFRIENRDALTAIGLGHLAGQGLNFDYVSYRDMQGGMSKLEQLWQDWGHKEENQRTPLEQAVVALGERVIAYQHLFHHFDVLRIPVPLEGAAVQALFGGQDATYFSDLLQKRRDLQRLVEADGDGTPGNASLLLQRLEQIGNWGHEMSEAGRRRAPAFFPPVTSEAERYLQVEELAYGEPDPRHVQMLAALERMAHSGHNAGSFQNAAGFFHTQAVELATARGDYDKVAEEVRYYDLNLHYKALHWFLFSFVVVALVWLFPRVRVMHWLGIASVLFPLGLLTGDIVLRSLLRERPPITNLYDTFLFIGAVAVLVALVAEVINKRRIALSAAPIIGTLSVLLARKFEVMRGEDTLHNLQAVLDSNFWLATHVTTINIGYAAGMLAAVLGSFYLLSRIAGLFLPVGQGWLKSIARMTYGVTCFGLLFAVVGTILGGIWANDSWGRFWGWDPKENGALLICLAQIAMLHARMGGLLRDFGFAMAAAFTGTIVAFSWFHVNILGVGLHSYGFSGGLSQGLWTYYFIQWGLMAAGGVAWLVHRSRAGAPSPTPRVRGGVAGQEAPVT